MNFTYTLTNAAHLTDEQRADIENTLDRQAYVCQQEFEQLLDKYHRINVIAEAEDEATVTNIEIDSEDCFIQLDCAKVIT